MKRWAWLLALVLCLWASTTLAGTRWDQRLMVLVQTSEMQNLAMQDLSGDLLCENDDKLIGENQ